MWLLLSFAVRAVLGATGPANNGRAVTPPQGWRHWNQWNGAINHQIIEGNTR